MPSKRTIVDIGHNLDLIYKGNGTPENPGLSISQMAQFWGVPKEYGKIIKEKNLTVIDPSQKHKYTLAVGGYRSGKTFLDLFKGVFKSIKYPAYKHLVVRKQHAQLRDTYVADFYKFIRRITENQPELLILDEFEVSQTLHILLRGPTPEPAEWIFRIEPDGDFTKIRDSFKGYELGGFTMEEASELQHSTWKVLRSRFSWKGGPCHGGMLSNPGFRGQWLSNYAQQCEVDMINGKKPDCLIIRSETYENAHNLPQDYIADLEQQYKDDPVGLEMALLGKDGVIETGVPVFKGYFTEQKNVDPTIMFNPYLPLVRGWDFGHRAAACAFWQFTKEGHAVKISELIIENMYIDQFTDAVIRHTKEHYDPKAGIVDYGDFAGLQQKDTGSSIQRVRDYTKGAIQINAKYFGDMDAGLNHMKKLMSTTVNNKFRYRVHPRCKMTIEGNKWGFYYKVMSDGRIMAKPFDNEYMHGQDADRYAICNAMPIEEEKASEWGGKSLKAKGLVPRSSR